MEVKTLKDLAFDKNGFTKTPYDSDVGEFARELKKEAIKYIEKLNKDKITGFETTGEEDEEGQTTANVIRFIKHFFGID